MKGIDFTLRLFGPFPNDRPSARKLSSKYYFTGNSCVNEHTALRRTSTGYCLVCRQQWNEKNQASQSLYYKSWRKENKDDLKAYHEKWRSENADKVRLESTIRARAYRNADRQKFNDRARRHYAEGMRSRDFREKCVARARNQRAKRRGAEGTFSIGDVALIISRQKFRCAECGVSVRKKQNRHVDHIMPLAKGGTNWPDNLQILCPTCNMSKGALHPIDYAQRKGRLL